MVEVVELARLSHSQIALTAAYKAGLPLQERGWMRYPPACWGNPAIVAMEAGRCVGALNFTEEEDELTVSVNFAFAAPDRPHVLAILLARFRAKYRGSRFEGVTFTCHEGNEEMKKAVRVLGLVPTSHSYRLPLSELDRKGGR